MPDFISSVLCGGCPSQVAVMVVPGITIPMSTLMGWRWRRSYKSQQHLTMCVDMSFLPLDLDLVLFVTSFFHIALQYGPCDPV
jgi:hypothetical protein